MTDRIFISYCHIDEIWVEKIAKFLRNVCGEDKIIIWDDRRIAAGDNWFKEIEQAIYEARIAILLISIDFLDSDFINKKEIPDLLMNRNEKGLRIIPFILRSCNWGKKLPWLSFLQARPKDAKPLLLNNSEAQIEEILRKFADEIYEFLPKEEQKPSEETLPTKTTKPTRKLRRKAKRSPVIDTENCVESFLQYVDSIEKLPDQIIQLIQSGEYNKNLYLGKLYSGDQTSFGDIKNLPLQILRQLHVKGYLNLAAQETLSVDDIYYEYLARRYGMGYRLFQVNCKIDQDGSAIVNRSIVIEAFSLVSEVPTSVNFPEKDQAEKYKDIDPGKIDALDDHKLTIDLIDRKPGIMKAKIRISPPLAVGEILSYQVSDYSLPKGLFGINLSKEEYNQRENPVDYFGWQVNQPMRNFVIQVKFPFGSCPSEYWHEVRWYATTAQEGEVHLGEQGRIERPKKDPTIDPDLLRLEVDFPLNGLVYILGWKPLLRAG